MVPRLMLPWRWGFQVSSGRSLVELVSVIVMSPPKLETVP